uniref:F-box domain-containing protein n=1 Tax=Mycena chlorophos TaxID=658473 RepID=A0ABQ0LKZ6_MYCCL|nr:predicted protein [Mycena chlorophos]
MANTVDSATMAKQFLGRSHPFTFPLDVGDMPMDVRKEVVRAMRRVAGLSLVTTQLLEDMIGDNCPFLENLHILSIDLSRSTSASKSPKIVAFLTAAKLARVRLTGIFLPLPWSKLQELTLVTDSSIVSASTCFASIVQCVQLVTLKLTMPIWFEEEPSDPQPPQTLPLLTSLDFCVAGGDFLFPFFAGLSLPSLRTFALELGLDYGWTPETQDEITEFFSRCPHLDKLSLRRCEINDIDLQEMLVQTPMLQELKLTTCFMDAFTSSIVEQLTYNPNDAILRPLVPQLHSLEVEGFYGEMEDTTLQAMIESRLAENLGAGSVVVGWRRIFLVFAGDGNREREAGEPLGASLRVRVVQLKAGGLDITIL